MYLKVYFSSITIAIENILIRLVKEIYKYIDVYKEICIIEENIYRIYLSLQKASLFAKF